MTETIATYLWIGLGSALGGMGRYWMASLVTEKTGGFFPWGTLAVNVIGSLVIGLLAAMSGQEGRLLLNPKATQFLMIGICGGFTTFSTFSLQTLNLIQIGEWGPASLNCLFSVGACLIAVGLGYALGQMLSR